jgi:hypothetical protein
MSSYISSRESSPNSQPSYYQLSEDHNSDDSYSTYLECHNQEHYYEKYHKKTGHWLPETRTVLTPLLALDGDSETRESAMRTEQMKTPIQVSQLIFPLIVYI